MVVLFGTLLTWLQWLMKPQATATPCVAKPVLDTAERLRQWTQMNTPLTSPHPRALNPIPEPSLC
jgi:hypothetical protein